MKLVKFIVENVRGFLTKEIKFRENVTFLIGINGSGKTSVLNLLVGLLSPNIRILIEIQYDEIQLVCKTDNGEDTITISSKKSNNTITISYKDKSSNYCETFDIKKILGIENFTNTNIVNNEDFKRIDTTFHNTDIYKCIKNIGTPVVVGLNRVMTNKNLRNFIFDTFPVHSYPIRNTEDYITKALIVVQELIYNNIRQTARRQSKLADDFKTKVYEEMLTPAESVNWKHDYKKELELLQTYKNDLITGLNDRDLKNITERVNNYILKYEEAITAYKNYSSQDLNDDETREDFMNIITKLMSYSFQYDKIVKVAEYTKKNLNEISMLRQPINRFVNSVNLFFKECNKRIVVGGNGDVIILNSHNAKQTHDTIFNLSSGEKHIIILMAYLSLAKGSNYSNIYMVDEPEISLHITWQQQFVDALMAANPSTQIILATHSPSIIAKVERRNWCEDLTLAR